MAALLVIDTCGTTGFVAVSDPLRPWPPRAAAALRARETQERLMGAVAGVLSEGGVAAGQLAAVAVVNGPGSFTGVRIGLAAAKGLCEALALPIVALSRLAVAAQAAGDAAAQPVTALLDAGRSDVYAATYRLQPGKTPFLTRPERMLPRETAMTQLAFAVTADARLAETDARIALLPIEAVEQATASLAARLFLQGAFADVALLDANYLRVPDAEVALRARQAAETLPA